MRPKSMMLLLVALGCGLVASIGITQALKQPAPTEGPGATTPIFVAKNQIGLGDPLKPENLKLEEWPTDKVPGGALVKLEDTEDRRTRTTIFPGEPIIEQKLLAKGEVKQDATDLIPKGYRVVSIKVDAVSGAASLLKPGDRVDVLVHLAENPSRGITKTKTVTFLHRIKVFALDDIFRRDGEGETSLSAKTVSLLVTPSQAELVTLASELGNIRLVMRSSSDEDSSESVGATADGLFADGDEKQETPQGKNPLLAQVPPPKRQENPVIEPLPPVEKEPPVPETPKNIFKMLILEGETRRDVEFQDGVLVHDNGAGATVPEGSASSTPASAPSAGAASAPAVGGEAPAGEGQSGGAPNGSGASEPGGESDKGGDSGLGGASSGQGGASEPPAVEPPPSGEPATTDESASTEGNN